MIRRIDAPQRFNLLSLESRDKDSPLLPHSQTVTDSPLHALLGSDDELTANLMGAGPWTLQMALKVPNGSRTLHFSNKNWRAPIQISHTLKIVIRVERGDDKQLDPKTGKRKRFDIILHMPVHILSVLYLHTFIQTNKHGILTVQSLEPVVGERAGRCTPTLHRETRRTVPTTRPTRLLGESSVLSTSLASYFCATEFDYCRAVRAIRLARRAIARSGHAIRAQRDFRTAYYGAAERGGGCTASLQRHAMMMLSYTGLGARIIICLIPIFDDSYLICNKTGQCSSGLIVGHPPAKAGVSNLAKNSELENTLPKGRGQQLLMDIEMPKGNGISIVCHTMGSEGRGTHVWTRPSARHEPSPFSPQVTIHRPRTLPAESSVSATVSSSPGRTAAASSGGSCTLRASSQRANARVASPRNAGS